MSKENPYLDGVQHIREPFGVDMSTSLGVGTLRFAYWTAKTKPGHYREVEITLDRRFVGYLAEALYEYLESEEADIRKLRNRLEGSYR